MNGKPSGPHPATRRRVGVVTDLGVVTWESMAAGGEPVELLDLGVLHDPARLLTWAQGAGFEQIWLHRSFLGAHGRAWGALSGTPASAYPPRVDGWSVMGDHWLHCYRAGAEFDRRPVDVVIPARDTRAAFWDDLSAVELRRALFLFEDAMTIRYRRSPEATGSRLMTRLHDGGRSYQLPVTEMPPPALDPKTETDPYWIREGVDSAGSSWIVAYDANAAYLAATSSLRTGMGAMRRVTIDELATETDGGRFTLPPSYLYARIDYTPPAGLLNPFREGWSYVTSPIVELAVGIGAHVEITEGWTWESWGRPLESWYRVVREGRGYLMELDTDVSARYALKAVKLLYGPFLGGRVASTKWERDGDPLYRPDWRHFVMATTRANQYRTLLRCASVGVTPFAIASDCLYFLTAAPDPEHPPAGLRMGTNPGAYKWVNAAPLSDPDAVCALSPALAPRRRLKHLQSAMRSQA